MLKQRTVLIIEDNSLNREILANMLENTYNILTAENGKEGFELLMEYEKQISLILLDIQMPVMNGYEFLDAVRKGSRYNDIPIIVTTASSDEDDELSCLEMGASDFVVKPYRAKVVQQRVASMIRLREASAMLHRVEKDVVTGCYSKEFFKEYVMNKIKSNSDKMYDIICINVESEKLLHDRYGDKKVNALMRYIAEHLKKILPHDAIIGRTNSDLFAVFREHIDFCEYQEAIQDYNKVMKTAPIPNVSLKSGVYENVDSSLTVDMMCYNAFIAIADIKHKYGVDIATYDNSLRDRVYEEQTILDNMETALAEHQFKVYYQPKHNVKENRTGGAEALVRWIHPQMGFMNPGKFIPLFEKNGFIHELDTYMLESVCRDLREWIDAGQEIVPISVNVSQLNFDQSLLDDDFAEIVDRYNIPHEYIHFEITESVYAADRMRTTETVNGFKNKGFSIELDDFGSGYSSLITLSELPIDVLKLDMSLIRNMFEEKHKAILEVALFMAKKLGMKVVAEGVEEKEQVQELRRMTNGQLDVYIQGYFYSKPISKEDFRKYLDKTELSEQI